VVGLDASLERDFSLRSYSQMAKCVSCDVRSRRSCLRSSGRTLKMKSEGDFPLTIAEQVERYERELDAEDRALYLKDQTIRARHATSDGIDHRHTEADLPEHISGPISRIMEKLMEGRG